MSGKTAKVIVLAFDKEATICLQQAIFVLKNTRFQNLSYIELAM